MRLAAAGGGHYRGTAIKGLQGSCVFAAIGSANVMALRAPDYRDRVVLGQIPGGGAITGFCRGHDQQQRLAAAAGVGRGAAAVASRLPGFCRGQEQDHQPRQPAADDLDLPQSRRVLPSAATGRTANQLDTWNVIGQRSAAGRDAGGVSDP